MGKKLRTSAMVAAMFHVATVFAANVDDAQVNEAAAVFDVDTGIPFLIPCAAKGLVCG